MRLYVLDTGLIECSDYALFSPGAGAGAYREMSVRRYLVVHPEGTLLWDTGIDDAIAGFARADYAGSGTTISGPAPGRGQLLLRANLRARGDEAALVGEDDRLDSAA